MAYENGIAVSGHDLLDKLRIFLVANGWTQNGWADDDTGYDTGWAGLGSPEGKRLHVSKTSSAANGSVAMYFNFKSCVLTVPFEENENNTTGTGSTQYSALTGIAINGSTGYNGTNIWDEQPGHPQADDGASWGAAMQGMFLTTMNYWFFQDGDCTHVVVEISAGKFQHMSFGCLDKQGTITGGQFFEASVDGYRCNKTYYDGGVNRTKYGCYHNTPANGGIYLTLDSDTLWCPHGLDSGVHSSESEHRVRGVALSPGESDNILDAAYPNSAHKGMGQFIVENSPNTFNGLSPMLPFYYIVERTSDNYSMLGWPANLWYIDTTNFNPGESLTLGSDTYIIFPLHSKNDGSSTENGGAGVGGIAIKKVV